MERRGEAKLGAGSARAVGLPSSVSVGVLTCDPDNCIAAIHHALRMSGATRPILFLPAGRSIKSELQLLQQCDFDAISLGDALEAVRASSNGLSPYLPPATEGSGQQQPRLLVASATEARGIDLPEIDLVLVWGVPETADQFVHVAGRTGRKGLPGKVVVLSPGEEGEEPPRLSLLGSQLGIDLSEDLHHMAKRNERWAEMWTVHEKVVQAETKY